MENVNEKVLVANHSNIVIKLLKNKYVKTKTEGGLIIPTGLTFTQETGQIEDILKEIIVLAEIINCGPECRYHVAGDEIFADSRSLRPIPFMGKGYFSTNEQNILCKVQ